MQAWHILRIDRYETVIFKVWVLRWFGVLIIWHEIHWPYCSELIIGEHSRILVDFRGCDIVIIVDVIDLLDDRPVELHLIWIYGLSLVFLLVWGRLGLDWGLLLRVGIRIVFIKHNFLDELWFYQFGSWALPWGQLWGNSPFYGSLNTFRLLKFSRGFKIRPSRKFHLQDFWFKAFLNFKLLLLLFL